MEEGGPFPGWGRAPFHVSRRKCFVRRYGTIRARGGLPSPEKKEDQMVEQQGRDPRVVKATDEFNLIWQNDYDVYHAVLREVRDMLARVPGMTPQTVGRNVKDRVFAWAYGGGWGYSDGWNGALGSLRDEDRYPGWIEGPPPAGYRVNPFSYFLDRDAYRYVSEESVGEDALDAVEVEFPKEDA